MGGREKPRPGPSPRAPGGGKLGASQEPPSTGLAPALKAPNLRVPMRHIDPLALLLRATEAEFGALERELAQVARPRSIRSLVTAAARRAGWPQPRQAETLAALLVSLASMADSFPNMSIGDFAATIVRAAEATEDKQLQASREQWDILGNRLARLLGPNCSLWLWAKSTAVLSEHERQFCDARILTDIRPIFDRQIASGPAALSVLHTLKLLFHRGSEALEELFIALDFDDLQTLKQVIQRAEEKQASLESLIRGTRVPLLLPKND